MGIYPAARKKGINQQQAWGYFMRIRWGWYSSSMVGVESQGFAAQFLHAKGMWAVSEHFQLVYCHFCLGWSNSICLVLAPYMWCWHVSFFLLAARQSSLQPLPRGDCGHRNVCDAGVMQPSELAGHLHPIKSALWEPTGRLQVLWEANCRHLQRNCYVTGSVSGWEWPDSVGPCMASPL